MKSTGIVRKINGLGRIVLPVGVRRMLGIEIGDGVEIYADGGDVILRKHVPGCVPQVRGRGGRNRERGLRRMKVISIVNLKGGVGKTATAINMASILATEHGKRVLLIDADPQANATRFFGGENAPAKLYDVFTHPDTWGSYCWMTQVDGVDIIPASMDLLQLDVAAATADAKLIQNFADFVGDMRDEPSYDYVIIDCPPGFTAVSIAGISVSDDIIIPAKVDAFAISGIDELTAQIRAVQTVRSGIRIAGVLVTMWHNAPVVTQGEQYLRAMDVPVFETTIRRTDKMDEATFARQPISDYSRWCAAARDYRDFVDEYVSKEAADDEQL